MSPVPRRHRITSHTSVPVVLLTIGMHHRDTAGWSGGILKAEMVSGALESVACVIAFSDS
jgi:hypothetical protein